MVDASFTDLRSRDGSWGSSLNHVATNSPSGLLTGRLQNNEAKAWVTRFVGKEKVDVAVHAGQERVLLYGFDTLAIPVDGSTSASPSVNWLNTGAEASFQSFHKDSTAFNHTIDLSFGYMTNQEQGSERTLRTDISGFTHVGAERVQIDFEMQLDKSQVDTIQDINQAIVSLEPSITTYRGPLRARVGLGMAIDADRPSRDQLGQAFHVYPRATVDLNLLRDLFIPYLQFGGDLEANNLHSLRATNPFFNPSQLESVVVRNNQDVIADGFRSTNKRFAFAGGIRGTLSDVIGFHGYASTAQHEDFVLFKPTFDQDSITFSEFEATYDTLNIATVGGELEIQVSPKLQVKGSVQFRTFGNRPHEELWNLPRMTWDAKISYALIDGLSLESRVQVVGSRYTLVPVPNVLEPGFTLRTEELPSYLDVNLSANYDYNERLGAWLTLANMSNARYAVWGGFPVQGFQVLAGVHYAF